MMATGSLLALVILPVLNIPHREEMLLCAAGLTAVFGVIVLPPIATRVGHLATKPFGETAEAEPHTIRWLTVLIGVTIISLGWLLMGLSMAAVLAATNVLPAVLSNLGPLKALGLLTAVVALATVGGFVSMLPGGIGFREWVLIETLAPILGAGGVVAATAAAVLLRVLWLVSEAVGTGLFLMLDRICKSRRIETH